MRAHPLNFNSQRDSLSLLRSGLLWSALTVAVALASGCSFREDPDAEKKADPAPVREAVNKHTISKRDFRIEFLPQERPNDYLIRLHWPAGKDVALNITRVRPLDNAGRPLGPPEYEPVSAQDQTYKVVGHCPASGTFELTIQINSPLSGFSASHDISGVCPRDFEIKRSEVVSVVMSNLNYHPGSPIGRLFMLNGSLLTIDTDTDLNLSGLIIEGTASIRVLPNESIFTQRLPEHWKAPKLRLKAQSARGGHLNLVLEGRNGDDGVQPPPRAANPQLNGAPGEAAQVQVECRPRPASRLSPDTVGETCNKVCTKPPTNGSPGRPGQRRGEDGRPGLPGIGTSEVELDIAELGELQLSLELKPGKGGQGSRGGLGEPGGRGGAAGVNTDSACAPASPGPQAESAPEGARGQDGAHGGCGKIKLPRALQSRTSLRDLQLECSRDPRLIEWN
ncbi:MAG TPA: hypothetical protein PLZ57_07245 [Pseudobdellovibrionaceae bacterium]|nr:hypothetical protein [Pseudobdellovibrionaceae bacterium]